MDSKTRQSRARSRGTQDNTPTKILGPENNQSNAQTEESAKMVVIQGATPGLEVILDLPKTIIGRLRSNHLVLDSPTVSRRHGRVTRDNKCYDIEDINSRNGILINNKERLKPNERRLLFHGDTVKLGDQQLVFLNPYAFGDQQGLSNITFDREKVRAEVDTLLDRVPALKKSR